MGGTKNTPANYDHDDNDHDVVMTSSEEDTVDPAAAAAAADDEDHAKEQEEEEDDDDDEEEDADVDEEDDHSPPTRRNGRRAAAKGKKKYSVDDDDDDDDDDESEASSDDDEDDEEEEVVVPSKKRSSSRYRSSSRRSSSASLSSSSSSSSSNNDNATNFRRSNRSTKFQASMKDPSGSLNDLYKQAEELEMAKQQAKKLKKKKQTAATANTAKSKSKSSKKSTTSTKSISSFLQKSVPKKKKKKRGGGRVAAVSPPKSRRHSTNRRRSSRNSRSVMEVDSSSDDDSDNDDDDDDHDNNRHDEDSDAYIEEEDDIFSDDDGDDDEDEEEDDDETMKIQRILAVRSETKKRWKEICKNMQSSEVTDGSRWYQGISEDDNDDDHDDDADEDEDNDDDPEKKIHDKDEDDRKNDNGSAASSSPPRTDIKKKIKTTSNDDIIEERYLVKWHVLSFLHVTWETKQDLMDQTDPTKAKQSMSTFHRKQYNGFLFTSDERKDGENFDPGLIQIERVCEIEPPNGMSKKKTIPTDWLGELAIQEHLIDDHGIVLDNKTDPDAFEAGAGRQFLIKWSSLNYNDMTYEFERDLILADQHDELKDKLKEYYDRTKKPSKKELTAQKKNAEDAKRRAYLLFGDNSRKTQEEKDKEVKQYQEQLCDHVYLNGGSLRDYQAEGVTWFLANYINQRSCIMADEMGLGKTLQTAAFIQLLVEKMHQPGPFLICVPLSTLAHWQREFIGWTGLNTIVYHGSADDRKRIREVEFAYEKDRPDKPGWGVNSLYLKKCEAAKRGSGGYTQWMTTVVVTTPEMLVADDWNELTFVKWSVLVVDEAHRLKNHNSKLAATMRKEQFKFQHKILLTGTPIQNDVKEFWTLLNFIDPDNYDNLDEFLEEYGEVKSKEKIDDLHEQIRPYILRRLKEDVEKSVPPKEETLIEVELTIAQKQYYRALFEKNVGFLHKGKKKALDGPSLSNLAMQLRKCCNHLFLLNGVEGDMRVKEKVTNEGDFIAAGSGKLVLLDKLLPRLKTDGHRILIFSQFKIMLDILEDYLNCREYRFERIDGSITGQKRQSAIDRFQDSTSADPPFVMMLSTRAGGVGINLTAADTCVIFDSDWNPQNDIQAMARCHRIGQTKNVKVYRLLTSKTYEMQMFHMSSLKMGLDEAVLHGFQKNSSGEGAMTKDEIEKLLRHGAYDIMNEHKAGTAEAESNAFKEQDIDSILSRRSRKVVHDNTGSGSKAAGGTFSKASFVNKTPSKKGDTVDGQAATEDVDVNDPDFWTKMVGEAKPEAESILKPRKRTQVDYKESEFDKKINKALKFNDNNDDSDALIESDEESDDDDSDESAEDPSEKERSRWGGKLPDHWTRKEVESVITSIERHGYANITLEKFRKYLSKDCEKFSHDEIKRMLWSLVLLTMCEVASSKGISEAKRNKTNAERKQKKLDEAAAAEGVGEGLAEKSKAVASLPKSNREMKDISFKGLWDLNVTWAEQALSNAVSYATHHNPRSNDSDSEHRDMVRDFFKADLWPSLQTRGWKVENEDEDDESYIYGKQQFPSASAAMNDVIRIHPELQNMVLPLLGKVQQSQQVADERSNQEKLKDLDLKAANVDLRSLEKFLERYAPKQLLHDRHRSGRSKLSLRQKILYGCYYKKGAMDLLKIADEQLAAEAISNNNTNAALPIKSNLNDKLIGILGVDTRSGLPHALWNPKHDAVLIRSVAKHGWVDIDSNLKRIVNDKDIKWGFPFESSDDEPIEELCEAEKNNLIQTAERAAAILNDKPDVIESLSAFNKKLVIDSYGLTQEAKYDDMDEGKKWKVDVSLLNQASKINESSHHEAIDLPAKKDFVKRAKTVILKSLSKNRFGNAMTKSSTKAIDDEIKSTTESNGFVVIDQGSRRNILLAELCRGVIKGSTKNAVEMRKMWLMIIAEAMSLKTMIAPQNDKKKETEELCRISAQINLAKKTSKRASNQAKNVLRVMLGEKPVVPRCKEGEKAHNIFPTEKPSTTAASAGTGSTSSRPKAPPKKKIKKNDPTIGDKALMKAMKKAHDLKSETNFGSLKDNKDHLCLKLTMIEMYILSVFCSQGMPILVSESKNSDNGSSKTLTKSWNFIAGAIELISRQQIQLAKEQMMYSKAAMSKGSNQKFDEDKMKVLTEHLSKAEADYAEREEAARQAADFNTDPNERLAKKSIMLMEKIRAHGSLTARPRGKNSSSTKYDNGLGAKVSDWFKKELARIAENYDILDDENRPQSWTVFDIDTQIENNPEYNKMHAAMLLDTPSARQVSCQIAMLSRLCDMLTKHSEQDFRVKLQRAMKNSKRNDDEWDKKPEWWDDSTDEHSFLLLKKLDQYGFHNIMESVKARDGFGKVNVDYDDMAEDLQLTKFGIQIKSNQLIRELDTIESYLDMMKLVENRRRNSMNNQKFDSLVSCTNGGLTTPSSSSSAAKSTVQTGLKAFFSTSSSKKKKTPSPAGSKRKESPSSSPVIDDVDDNNDAKTSSSSFPPAEKKVKNNNTKTMDIDDGPSPPPPPPSVIDAGKSTDAIIID